MWPVCPRPQCPSLPCHSGLLLALPQGPCPPPLWACCSEGPKLLAPVADPNNREVKVLLLSELRAWAASGWRRVAMVSL